MVITFLGFLPRRGRGRNVLAHNNQRVVALLKLSSSVPSPQRSSFRPPQTWAPAHHGLPLRCAAAAGCATSARAVPLLHTPSCFWARVERGQRRATSGRLLIAQHLGSIEHTILGATAVVTRCRSYFALRRSPLGWALGPLRCQGSPNAVHDPPALPGERGRARSLCRVRGAMPPKEALTDCAVYVLVHRGGARRQVGKRTPRERLYPPHCPRLASGAELHAISAATSPRC